VEIECELDCLARRPRRRDDDDATGRRLGRDECIAIRREILISYLSHHCVKCKNRRSIAAHAKGCALVALRTVQPVRSIKKPGGVQDPTRFAHSRASGLAMPPAIALAFVLIPAVVLSVVVTVVLIPAIVLAVAVAIVVSVIVPIVAAVRLYHSSIDDAIAAE